MLGICCVSSFDYVPRTQPDGKTNLWDGIRTGMTLVDDALCADRNVVVLVFTDGVMDEWTTSSM